MKPYIFLLALATAGCSIFSFKQAPLVLPPYMTKIAIRPFTNHTQQFGLEDKLTLATQSEFNRDGRVQITTEDKADGVVIGDISHYTLQAQSYDTNHVPTEYKLTILVDVSFHDRVKGGEMWTEPGMSGELRYFVTTSGFAGALSEDDARQTIFDQLARDIRTRTLEGTGASNKGAPGESSGTASTAPPPLNNNPPDMPSQEPSAPTKLPY
jgi:hypothetical protein